MRSSGCAGAAPLQAARRPAQQVLARTRRASSAPAASSVRRTASSRGTSTGQPASDQSRARHGPIFESARTRLAARFVGRAGTPRPPRRPCAARPRAPAPARSSPPPAGRRRARSRPPAPRRSARGCTRPAGSGRGRPPAAAPAPPTPRRPPRRAPRPRAGPARPPEPLHIGWFDFFFFFFFFPFPHSIIPGRHQQPNQQPSRICNPCCQVQTCARWTQLCATRHVPPWKHRARQHSKLGHESRHIAAQSRGTAEARARKQSAPGSRAAALRAPLLARGRASRRPPAESPAAAPTWATPARPATCRICMSTFSVNQGH